MKKFSWILLSTALLAACGTATTSGSTRAAVSSGSSFSYPGANAGSNVNGNSDVNQVNPLIGKAGSRPAPTAQPQAAPAPAPALGIAQDRCGGGIGNPPAAGNRGAPAAGNGKRPQLPACMPE